MNWDAIGAVGEIIGAAAVVASLIYLATQVRTQNREARIASVHEITEAYRQATGALQDPLRAAIFLKAVKDYEGMEEVEKVQFFSFSQSLFKVWEEAYYQRKQNRLDEHIWDGMLVQYRNVMGTDGGQHFWRLRKNTFSADFRSFVDTLEEGSFQI